ncbi:MAG: MerR family transcriptional regulator [Nitrospinota bacterium]
MNQDIPDKLFFKIGDVARIAAVEPYVLRYWESEFKGLNPSKNQKGQRVYRRKDVVTVLEIKALLYKDRYSIEGAKNIMSRRKKGKGSPETFAISLKAIREELLGILDILR